MRWRSSRFLAFAIAALGFRRVAGVLCDVGDAVDAVNQGSGQFEGATIVALDLSAAPAQATVDWDSGSPSHRHLLLQEARKSGAVCLAAADVGQTFAATTGEAMTLMVLGPSLTIECRLLLVGLTKTCGELSATAEPAVTSRPGVPVGVAEMRFFDVEVDTAMDLKVCFWSGQAVAGLGEGDVASYATTLGVLSVIDGTTTMTSTGTVAVMFSRRRGGIAYDTASLRVEGSQGAVFDGLTANPAAWNIHTSERQIATCRTCQAAPLRALDGNLQQAEANTLRATLAVETSSTPGVLGLGCTATGPPAPPAAPKLLLVARGSCSFEDKTQAAMARGFRGLLVADTQPDQAALPDMAAASGLAAEEQLPIPAWVVPKDEAEALQVLSNTDPLLEVIVEDVARKPRLATAQSDSYGARRYTTF